MQEHPAFLMAAAHRTFGTGETHLTPAVEGAALLMIGVLFFLLGLIGWCMWSLARRAREHPAPEAILIEEIARRPQPRAEEDNTAPERSPWERPGDWWR